jgi:succinyl-diaminopimelate desuccinylase
MADPVDLTQRLIRCPSVTPIDAGALKTLSDFLDGFGFKTHNLRYEEAGYPPVDNIFSVIGDRQAGPHLCFGGHTDVVPTGPLEKWTYPPFAAEIHDGQLYGRGAADMKSNVACFAVAAARYIEKNGLPKGQISMLITGDEEAEAVNGTVKVLKWMQDNDFIPDAALIGEPSNPKQLGECVKIGRRGSLNGDLTVTGKQGHVAYPQLADNPVPRLVRIAQALSEAVLDTGNAHFQSTNLEITSIDVGNPADNILPETARAKFNIRFNDTWTAQSLEAEIRRIIDATGEAYTLGIRSNAECFITKPSAYTELVVGAVKSKTGLTPELSTSGGTSDARFIAQYCPVVEFGIINATNHQIDEHVKVSDIEDLTDIYEEIITRFFA